jgi:Fic family protein
MNGMATVRKRKIGGREYFYLEHTMRTGRKVGKKEMYLGTGIPKDIEKIKAGFMGRIYQERWFSKIDRIKQNFSEDFGRMPGEIKEKYLENFMIRFTYDTNRIEGGSLSLREAAGLLKDGIAPSGKPIKDVKEAEAHMKVFYMMLDEKGDLDLETVLKWHRLLFEGTKPGIAGRIRDYGVGILGSRAVMPPPAGLKSLLRGFFRWYEKNKGSLHPVELAALVHLKFVSIHPFGDGNGRASRLMMNFVLHRHGYPMLNIAYKNRSSYYAALERSQLKKDDWIFVVHILKRYIKEYKSYLKKQLR